MNMTQWDIEKIREGFKRFYIEHGRYPTTHEIDAYQYLPSSRQIQRKFGGLPQIREQLKLDGPRDFTKGEYSSERASSVGKRAHVLEKEVYDHLVQSFGKPFVHREFFFSDDARTRVDFFVYCADGDFALDIFYPKDRFNFIGCLNSKMRTYSNSGIIKYPVLFVVMNNDMTEEEIQALVSNKKNKLQAYQRVVTWRQAKAFCKTKRPRKP